MTDQPPASARPDPETGPETDRFRGLVRASLLAISADAGLILLLYGLSRLTGSTVLLADALHSLGDLGVSATVLVAILASHRFLNRAWGRFLESVLSLGIAALLGLGAVELLGFVVTNPPDRFMQARDPAQLVAFAGVSVALVVTFAMARYKRRVGRRLDSPMFEAEGLHTYADFLTSLGVWLTLLVGYFGLDIERWMTGVIGLMILKMALELVARTAARLRVSWPTPLVQAARDMGAWLVRLWRRWPLRLRLILGALFWPQWPRRVWWNAMEFCRTVARTLERHPAPVFLRQEWIESHARLLVGLQLGLVVLLYLGLGFYTVQPGQRGVELGLGRVTAVRDAGLHIHLPPPFGWVEIVDADLVSRLELGYRTNLDFTGEEPAAYLWESRHSSGRYTKNPDEALTLAGDENLIDSNFVCYYRITDPVRHRLHIRDTVAVLRAAFAHEVHAAQRRRALDAMLTAERDDLQGEILAALRRQAQGLDLGVEITRVCLLEAHPPLPVVPQYRGVVSAKETQNEVILRAQQYANELLPRSRGQAVALVGGARADSLARISEARGTSENFELRQTAFARDSGIHRVRLHWEALESALTGKPVTLLPAQARRRLYLDSVPGGFVDE